MTLFKPMIRYCFEMLIQEKVCDKNVTQMMLARDQQYGKTISIEHVDASDAK